MRRAIMAALTVLAGLAAGPAAGAEEAMKSTQSATALAVTWEDGSLLLRGVDGFPLLVLAHEAVIRDSRGAAIALTDMRPGDRVEYVAERWAGMVLATSLRVTSPYTAGAR